MNILGSGKHLFVVGGGSFKAWVVRQFLIINNNNVDRKGTAICKMNCVTVNVVSNFISKGPLYEKLAIKSSS